ncbi:hypothetical protein [Deinococcus radiotolerans]|uniref:Uncharacterized protein n=1 Tax=Deinococcus radiotolerans TaxID=1309407 RepID=A0ABQ2FRF1_9DEIO|nr:hypothetical protein [Deinococcus radiotolerans]GGL19673.1 hypothetical protein GCM10010844_43330 [Deinococcus radiotolerans]
MLRLFTLTVMLFTPAAAATAPTLTGEWLSGFAYPAAVYESAYSGAQADTTRLTLRPDGQYTLTDIDFTYVPGYFGAYVITCGTLTVTTESGRYQRSGDQVTFTPAQGRRISGLSPQSLNSGCKRSQGDTEPRTAPPYRATIAVQDAQLTVNVDGTRRTYVSRAAAQATAAADQAAWAQASAPSLAADGPVTPGRAAPAPAAAPVRPAVWSATGRWTATLDIPGQRVTLTLDLYDDGETSLSGSGFVGPERVAWVLGPRSGAFMLGVDAGDGTVTFHVTGTFTGDQFRGTFRAVDDADQPLGSGTVTMQRP